MYYYSSLSHETITSRVSNARRNLYGDGVRTRGSRRRF